ncbi:alpha-amylase family glycosyl hydrolase [Undibacterium arcticum]
MTIPRATVRLQFNRDFTLDDAARLVDYYAALGISHFYASPLQTARPGSTHGYDIVDPTAINPELGGEPALRRLVTRLRAARMGLILDLVPNHMGVGGSANRWWQHLLEWGAPVRMPTGSISTGNPTIPALRGKVLMPFLAERYGKVLPAGEIGLRFDETDGRIFLPPIMRIGCHCRRPIIPTFYAPPERNGWMQRLLPLSRLSI